MRLTTQNWWNFSKIMGKWWSCTLIVLGSYPTLVFLYLIILEPVQKVFNNRPILFWDAVVWMWKRRLMLPGKVVSGIRGGPHQEGMMQKPGFAMGRRIAIPRQWITWPWSPHSTEPWLLQNGKTLQPAFGVSAWSAINCFDLYRFNFTCVHAVCPITPTFYCPELLALPFLLSRMIL